MVTRLYDSGCTARQPLFDSPKYKAPESALSFAQSRLEHADKKIEAGNAPEAYEDLLQAWQALQPHLHNKRNARGYRSFRLLLLQRAKNHGVPTAEGHLG